MFNWLLGGEGFTVNREGGGGWLLSKGMEGAVDNKIGGGDLRRICL